MLGEEHPIVRNTEQETMYQAKVILRETENNWEICALNHQDQHKWFPEHFVATASSRPLSSKQAQYVDRDQAAQSGTGACEDSTAAQTDRSTEG